MGGGKNASAALGAIATAASIAPADRVISVFRNIVYLLRSGCGYRRRTQEPDNRRNAALLGLCRVAQTSGFVAARSIAPGRVKNQLVVRDAKPTLRNSAGR